jgi:hypothetical protein
MATAGAADLDQLESGPARFFRVALSSWSISILFSSFKTEGRSNLLLSGPGRSRRFLRAAQLSLSHRIGHGRQLLRWTGAKSTLSALIEVRQAKKRTRRLVKVRPIWRHG